MATIPLTTFGPTVDAAGISTPEYTDILETLKYRARQIFGDDIYLEPDSQDGAELAIFAKAVADGNDGAVAAFNQMSPLTAQGEGLSSVVKINGITRNVATNSQVDVVLTGVVGTIITNGQARDTSGQIWKLPASVTIPVGGSITVTATAALKGDIRAGAHEVHIIATPTAGWNSVDNPAAAVVGQPVESDAALRRRQTQSVANSTVGILAALVGTIKDVDGVVAAEVYVNDTGSTDADGIPAHSLACVVLGGDANDVANAIMQKRMPGVGLSGTTTVNLTNNVGHTEAIKFTVPAQVTCKTNLELHALTGYTSDVGDGLKQALADFYDGLPIGKDVPWARAVGVAASFSDKYEVVTVKLFRDAGTPTQADIAIDFDEKPNGVVGNIAIALV